VGEVCLSFALGVKEKDLNFEAISGLSRFFTNLSRFAGSLVILPPFFVTSASFLRYQARVCNVDPFVAKSGQRESNPHGQLGRLELYH
jgi:hypothetical protein